MKAEVATSIRRAAKAEANRVYKMVAAIAIPIHSVQVKIVKTPTRVNINRAQALVLNQAHRIQANIKNLDIPADRAHHSHTVIVSIRCSVFTVHLAHPVEISLPLQFMSLNEQKTVR